jgi:alpha-galactosidase
VGGFGHEEIQFQQFIEWGIDFIKLDKCNHENGWDDATFKQTYYKWHRLIRNEKRNILLSISARHPDNEWQEWFPEIGQMARTTDDIKAKVSGGAVFDHIPHRSVMRIAEENSRWAEYAGNGYWNDPDFLAIGDQGLTIAEQKVHFALWCIMSAPLILGNDPRNMTPEEKNLITNKWAIAINQDPDEQGGRIKKVGAKEIWAKKLTNGDLALLLLNRGDKKTIKIKISPKELEFSEKAIVREIFSDEEIGIVGKSFSKKIEPHNGLFLLLHKPK